MAATQGRHRRTGKTPAVESSEGEVVEVSSRKGGKAKTPMAADRKGQNIRSLVRSMEATCIRDPEGLAEMQPIIEAAQDVVNVTIATHAQRRKMGQPGAVPQKTMAEILGISEQAVAKRAKLGDEILQQREAMAETTRFAPAAALDRARRDAAVAAAQARMAAGGTEAHTGTDG